MISCTAARPSAITARSVIYDDSIPASMIFFISDKDVSVPHLPPPAERRQAIKIGRIAKCGRFFILSLFWRFSAGVTRMIACTKARHSLHGHFSRDHNHAHGMNASVARHLFSPGISSV
jgi:hypothetical protein